MSLSDLSIIRTNDGSDSLFSKRFQDTYHSKHGALQEGQYIFIDQGLDYLASKLNPIRILELGFGTGLNYLLTRRYLSHRSDLNIDYHTIDAYPLSPEIVTSLNYHHLFAEWQWFEEIHALTWNQNHALAANFSFTKSLMYFEDIKFQHEFDLIYFDAFAPQKQPDLWQEDFLFRIARAASTGAVLVTYCSQGAFRRSLAKVGFSVEKLPGPPGKREMVRAFKL